MNQQKKKIIIIGPAYPYRGGNSLFISHVFDSLKDDFEVKIYNYKLLYPSILFPGKTQYDESKSLIKKAANERVINSINPFNWFAVTRKLKNENADLLVIDWWHPFFSFCHFAITQFSKKRYKDKILFITENVISHEANFIDRMLTKIGLRNADKFLVLSQKVNEEVKIYSKEKKVYRTDLPVYDCYNFENEKSSGADRKQFGYLETDKVLLFFGYIRKYKGLDLLIDALPGLVKDDASYKLLVVGEFYDDEKIYFEQIEKLGLAKNIVTINQFVPNEEVHKYYSVADLVVLPYRSATQSGILNVSYGLLKPVLVTNVGGLSEFVDDEKTGIIIEKAEPKQIADGIRKFFSIKEKVNFAENIRAKIEQNSFSKLPELFQKIISEIDE
ncbi:MAG: glycosyltransferase [bacterium]